MCVCRSVQVLWMAKWQRLCVWRTALSLFFPQRVHPGLDSGATPSMAALATDLAQHASIICAVGWIYVGLIFEAQMACL